MLEFFFDWKKNQLTLRGDKEQQKFALEDGTQDHLSYILRAIMLAESNQRIARFKRISIEGLDYPPSSATRQPNLVASNPADIGKPGFLMMQTKVDFDQIWQCKEATR